MPENRPSRFRTPTPRRDGARPAASTRAPHAAVTGLRGLLRTIDGGPFQAYRRILGEHELGDFRLEVLSVPPDALGGPARLRLSIDRARAGLDASWSRGDLARLVIEDAIVRAAARALDDQTGAAPASAPGSGRLSIDPPAPGYFDCTTARVGEASLEVALSLELPAVDRRVRGQQAEAIFFEQLPKIGMAALLFPIRRADELKSRIEALARRRAVADALPGRGLALLVPPSALSDRMAPPGSMTTIETAHGPVDGLAVPAGITVFATVSVPGAGPWLRGILGSRDRVHGATAILAGPAAIIAPSRHVFGPMDLRAFVRACPELAHPEAYASEDAPAPLALAASIVAAIETGARIIVLDEDELPAGALGAGDALRDVVGAPSPLASLPDRLCDLRDRWGVTFLIAARRTSAFLAVADTVFTLHGDRLDDVSESVRTARRSLGLRRATGSGPEVAMPAARSMRVVTEGAPGGLKTAAWGARGVRIGDDLIDLTDTPLSGDPARLRTVAALLKHAARIASSWRPVTEVLDELETASARPVLDLLEEPGLVDLARPSRLDLAAALARWKRVAFRIAPGTLRPNAEDLP